MGKIFTLDIGGKRRSEDDEGLLAADMYAEKLGVEVVTVHERMFPQFHEGFEKMQLFELASGLDWAVWVDPGVVLTASMLDMSQKCPVDAVGHWGHYGASSWFNTDEAFAADTEVVEQEAEKDTECPTCHQLYAPTPRVTVSRPRDVAVDDSLLFVPKACHELWRPTTLATVEALAAARRPGWVCQWNLARNIAANRLNVFRLKSPQRDSGAQSDADCFIKEDS